MIGKTETVVDKYLEILSDNLKNTPVTEKKRSIKASLRAKLVDIAILRPGGEPTDGLLNGTDPIMIRLKIDAKHDLDTSIQIYIKDDFQTLSLIDSTMLPNKYFHLKKGINIVDCHIDTLNLYDGEYAIDCHLSIPRQEVIDLVQDAYFFSVKYFDPFKAGIELQKNGLNGFFHINHSWSMDKTVA
jgi:hypothetical protein